MRSLQTEILVIGGGATGTGVLRDLAMRGFAALLVEKGDLACGTSGRYHGLLHSGGRYVVRDPLAAQECIEENRILRRIMPQCIEDTGGFFVTTPWDDVEYGARFIAGCKQAGIPVEEVPIPHMLRQEPLLNPDITLCYRVPDGSADSFLAAELNVASARQYGSQALGYHKVTQVLQSGGRAVGARCHDLVHDEELEIHADMVVNASGAWAGQIAAMLSAPNGAPLKVEIVPGKGVMIAVNHRIVNTVINRCKYPSDGDILVPAHTVAVIGTTDVKVADPDHFAIEPWEVHLMLEEGQKIIPGFKEMRMLRAWAGVRPLYQESRDSDGTAASDNRDVTRAFVLLDHETRDGVSGFITITSGKWTTYRKMAEATVDLVCQKLGVKRPCRTHLEALPGHAQGYHYLGARLAHTEKLPADPKDFRNPSGLGHANDLRSNKEMAYGKLVCECELATYEDVSRAITEGQAKTIDDIRRDVRLGMGPCQGGFCTYRAAGILHRLRHPAVEETNLALRDFLQERWKGLLPILWGQQLRQERLDELIYLSLLNADHLPGPTSSRLSPEPYADPSITGPADPAQPSSGTKPASSSETPSQPVPPYKGKTDLLVVGAGLAGLTAAWLATARGLRVRLISKGRGALYWHAGCIDVLGYRCATGSHEPGKAGESSLVESPADALAELIRSSPNHPYALAGISVIEQALEVFQVLCASAGYPLQGSLERNWLLPSALGVPRPTCLAPETMVAGDLRRPDPMLIVGFEGYLDFYPGWIADNLSQHGVPASGKVLSEADLPLLRQRSFVTGRVLAELFEQEDFLQQLAAAIRSWLDSARPRPARIGLPAVLGLERPLKTLHHLQSLLALPIFEIPTLPPSIPGMRLHQVLVHAIEKMGGSVFDGMQVDSSTPEATGASPRPARLELVWSEAAARLRPHRAKAFVLATGGLLGGGLKAHHTGQVREVVCNLPVVGYPGSSASGKGAETAPSLADRGLWLDTDFLGAQPHPIYGAGVAVDAHFQPVDANGKVIYDNVYAVGALLSNLNDSLRERSLEGVALSTGAAISEWVSQYLDTETPPG